MVHHVGKFPCRQATASSADVARACVQIQELWYEAAHDPTILMPLEAELRPLFDQLHDELDDSATMELESRELEEEFDNALRSRGMVNQLLKC